MVIDFYHAPLGVMFAAVEYGINDSVPYCDILCLSHSKYTAVLNLCNRITDYCKSHPEFSITSEDFLKLYSLEKLGYSEKISHWKNNLAGMCVMYPSFENQRYPCFEIREV